jgi:3-oxoacyl-[acyl-carrier-protein] synthase II
MNDKVVISGAGLVSSLGLSAPETWEALLAGRCGIKRIDGFDTQGFDCPVAAQVNGLGPSVLGIHPRDSRIMDKHSYMLMKSSRDAFKQSRLNSREISPEDIGFFAGMGMVDYSVEDLLPSVVKSLDEQGRLDYDKFYSGAYQQIHPLWPLSMLNNINFCQVAIDLGIKGDNTTFCPHADSGVHGIIEAYNSVMSGRAKVALAGGVSEKVSPLSIARALWFGILNTSDNKCLPFGRDRRGTVLGEGSGTISLELQSTAEKRQAPSLAAVTGYGASFEISEGSNCAASGAIVLSMEQAIAMAGLKPSDIDLIIAHGDGTYTGDKHEIEAIHHTFSDCIDKVNVFSSKGALGHMLAGAAAVDAVLGIYILQHGIIPAVYDSPLQDEGIKFNLVSGKPNKSGPRRILINSRSYEGQCASLILEAVE